MPFSLGMANKLAGSGGLWPGSQKTWASPARGSISPSPIFGCRVEPKPVRKKKITEEELPLFRQLATCLKEKKKPAGLFRLGSIRPKRKFGPSLDFLAELFLDSARVKKKKPILKNLEPSPTLDFLSSRALILFTRHSNLVTLEPSSHILH